MKNKSLVIRIIAVLCSVCAICSCLILSVSATTKSNSYMTTTCTPLEATMKVSTGGYRTEKITCEISGVSTVFSTYGTIYPFKRDFSEDKTATNVLSCQLTYERMDEILYYEYIDYATFTGYIEQSIVGNWTLEG